MTIEERLRDRLEDAASTTRVSPDAWHRITARLDRPRPRRRVTGRVAIAAVAVAAAVAALVVLPSDGRSPRRVTTATTAAQSRIVRDGTAFADVGLLGARPLAFTSGGRLLAAIDGRLQVVGTAPAVTSPPPAWSADGAVLAYVDDSGSLQLWSADGAERAAGVERVSAFAWAPVGDRVAARQDDGRVVVVGVDGGSAVEVVARGGESFTWSPDGARLAVAARPNDPAAIDAVVVWSADRTDVIPVSGVDDGTGLDLVAWSPDGGALAVRVKPLHSESLAGGGVHLGVLDTASGRIRQLPIATTTADGQVAWSGQRDLAYIGGERQAHGAGVLLVCPNADRCAPVAPGEGAPIALATDHGRVVAVAVTADGTRRLATVSLAPEVRVDVLTGATPTATRVAVLDGRAVVYRQGRDLRLHDLLTGDDRVVAGGLDGVAVWAA